MTTDTHAHFDIIIIGGGHAGANLVSQLRRKKDEDTTIALFSDETHLPYHKPPLSKGWLKGEMQEKQLLLFPETLYANANCTLKLGEKITGLEPNNKTVTGEQGSYSYGSLVLATGGSARTLPIAGSDDPDIHVLRTRDHSEALKAKMTEGKKLVVIGGGYIGLEAAASARALGLEVTLLEAAPRVLARVTSPEVSAFYENVHKSEGVELLTDTNLKAFERTEDGLFAVTDAGQIKADIILVGIGLVPELGLAESARVETDNGILVDDHCQTSVKDIYAIGDNVTAPIPLYGNALMRIESVQNAVDQAATVASNLTGENAVYDPLPWFWSDQYDLKLKTAGINTGHDQVIARGNADDRAISFGYFKDGKLIAIDTINRAADFVAGQRLIKSGNRIDFEKFIDVETPLKSLL
jgi:3-phenylpropionate/trans-cinnamate dioxygenase ferredoxin reductase subunit